MSFSLAPLTRPDFAVACPLHLGEVHLWLLDIRHFNAAQDAEAISIMSAAEITRAGKFIRGKESFIASRWLLRKVLGRYISTAPESVEFLRTDKGKPYLPHSDIHFSLSHSGDWVLLAVSNIELVGVDVEAIRATRDLPGIAESYYHPHEFAQLQSLEDRVQTDYFYRLWTLKEAFFKAIGTGISAGLEKIAFDLTENQINARIDAALTEDGQQWQFQQWALTEQDYGALASRYPHPPEVKWFDACAMPAFP